MYFLLQDSITDEVTKYLLIRCGLILKTLKGPMLNLINSKNGSHMVLDKHFCENHNKVIHNSIRIAIRMDMTNRCYPNLLAKVE